MKVSSDKKCQESLAKLSEEMRWRAEEMASAHLYGEIRDAPEMTPIEQIVFFSLKRTEIELDITFTPQFKIGRYRVDFLVRQYNDTQDKFQIIIECDGHDFHEKTKDQAQHDKKRDRDLQALGFKVFHFTGSEIWRSTGECVIESLKGTIS